MAIALQEAGWLVRRDNIWHKTNGKPEAIYDRPTKAHDYVWLLVKQQRYWYDRFGYRDGPGNLRSVWALPTANFPGAHFAVMPEALAERCLLLGCPPHVCAQCGRPWRHLTHRGSYKLMIPTTPTEQWETTCRCGAGREPGVVLDPFGGAGTVAMVAQKRNRRSIYIDCSADYLAMAQGRLGAL